MSSTRVMATCAVMGQAAGTAAALCIQNGTSPRGIYENHVGALQQRLMDADCWLPGKLRTPDMRWFDARMDVDGEDGETLLDGWERDREEAVHGWTCAPGGEATFTWREEQTLPGLRLVLDSDLNHKKTMAFDYPVPSRPHAMPQSLARDLVVEKQGASGEWECVTRLTDNRKRLVEIPGSLRTTGIRIRLESSWGEGDPRLFSVDILKKEQDDTVQFPRGKTWKEVVASVPEEELQKPDTQAQGRTGRSHGA